MSDLQLSLQRFKNGKLFMRTVARHAGYGQRSLKKRLETAGGGAHNIEVPKRGLCNFPDGRLRECDMVLLLVARPDRLPLDPHERPMC